MMVYLEPAFQLFESDAGCTIGRLVGMPPRQETISQFSTFLRELPRGEWGRYCWELSSVQKKEMLPMLLFVPNNRIEGFTFWEDTWNGKTSQERKDSAWPLKLGLTRSSSTLIISESWMGAVCVQQNSRNRLHPKSVPEEIVPKQKICIDQQMITIHLRQKKLCLSSTNQVFWQWV